jgi:transcriptional regulator GlxA family with amidase domain
MKDVVTVLFDGFETLDAFGPIEVLGRLKGHFMPRLCSHHGGTITSAQGVSVLTAPASEVEASGHVLLVPGGAGTRTLVNDEAFIESLRVLAQRAEAVLTVCTGSVLFSRTGLLDGRRATSNKRAFRWAVEEAPAVEWVKRARWVKDGNVYTSSGVSAGIDMALGFVSDALGHDVARRVAAEMEYVWNEDAGVDPFADEYP